MGTRHPIVLAIVVFLIMVAMINTNLSIDSRKSDTQSPQIENAVLAVESDPIRIESNAEFIALGLPGNGTDESPFRFENLVFDLNKTDEYHCLYIYRTNVSFIVRNCVFIGDPEFPYGSGISLWNVSNAIITNNTFYRLGAGSMGGDNYKITDNKFYGQSLDDYDHDVIGISINWNQINCSNVLVEGNEFWNCSFGIAIYRADNSIFRNNVILNCSWGIHQRDVSQNISIVNNIVNNNTYSGIRLHETDKALIANNTCNFNRLIGLWIDEFSNNNTIVFNQAFWNGNASIIIEEPNPSYALLSQFRDPCGIWVHPDSSNNVIAWNDLAYNMNNALNDGANNIYDYNYWSDYEGVDEDEDWIGDVPYQTAGYVTAEDVHPRLTILREWNQIEVEPTTSSTPTSGSPNPKQQPLIMIIGFGSMIGIIVIVILYRKSKVL